MNTVQVSARWTGQTLRFVGTDPRGNEVKMGGQENLSPSHMLLLGLAGCTGMDVLSILQKKRQNVTDVEVQVTAQQPEEYPKPYQNIEINFTIRGENVDSKAVSRAIRLSETKYCIVNQTLQSDVKITTSFTIAE
jgi:putative redox protein